MGRTAAGASLRAAYLVSMLALAGCGKDAAGPEPDPASVPIAAIDHDALYVVNGVGNSITVVNTATHTVTGTIGLLHCSYPHHAYLTPDLASLAVAVPGMDLSGGHDHGGLKPQHLPPRGAVLVLDALTGATRVSRRLQASNHNAAPSPDGRELWTALSEDPGSVLVLDPTTLATLATIPVGNDPAEVTFTRDGRRAFVANTSSASVTVIDVATKAVLGTVGVGATPVGAWPGSDGVMYVDNEGSRSITAIDGTTMAVVRTYMLGFVPGMGAVSPGGELWVTDSENGKVVFFATDSDTRLGEVATGTGSHAILFGRDGLRAYVTNQAAGTLSVIDVATRSIVATIAVGAQPNGLAFRAWS